MTKLNILTFPDPRLRKKAKPIERFDKNLKDIAKKCFIQCMPIMALV